MPEKQKRFHMEFDLYLRGKRKKPSISATFVGRTKSGAYSTHIQSGIDVSHLESDAYKKVDTAIREFCVYLKTVGEID